MSRSFIHRYAVQSHLLADNNDHALELLLDAVATTLVRSERFHGAVTEAGEIVYFLNTNRAKARRLAARLDDKLNVRGGLSYLSDTPDGEGMYPQVPA